MACTARIGLVNFFCKASHSRFFSVQTCKFARGNRLILTPPALTATDPFVRQAAIHPDIPTKNVQELNRSEPAVISLDEHEVTMSPARKKSDGLTKSSMWYKNKMNLPATASVPFYEKLKDDDKRFSNLMTTLRSKKSRARKNQIVLEGQRLIQDAMDAGLRIQTIFFSSIDSLQALKIPKTTNVEIFKLPYKNIQLWSTVVTSAGIVGVFEAPPEAKLESLSGDSNCLLPLTLVCDNVREPGNLGAILRVAAGVGCKQVLLTKGCVDLWDSKVLRSAAGANFRVPVVQQACWDKLTDLVKKEDAKVFVADSRGVVDKHIPAQDYCDVNLGMSAPMVLVLGGETEGVSERAQQFNGCRLHIPLAGGVESLNVATALAVILFEMRRQRHLNRNESQASRSTMLQ